jgi:hypothetical protein
MKFSEKDRKDLESEFEETKVTYIYMASVIGVNPSYVSQYLGGVRPLTDDVVRKMRAVFVMVRAEHMRTGGFALDVKGMNLLRKRLAEMEKSIVRRPARKQPAAAEPVNKEAKACAN